MDDDIVRMAHQAGIVPGRPVTAAQLAELATLVRADEREACAKVCENIYTGEEACGDWPTPEMCAEAIRARGHQSAAIADRLARRGIPTPGDNT